MFNPEEDIKNFDDRQVRLLQLLMTAIPQLLVHCGYTCETTEERNQVLNVIETVHFSMKKTSEEIDENGWEEENNGEDSNEYPTNPY